MADQIGSRIRLWRTRRRLTQGALAGLAGVSQSYVSQVESGAKGIERRSTLVAFARALQISVADLIGQPGDPTDPVRADAATAVGAIHAALVELENDIVRPSTRATDEVVAAVEHVKELRAHSDYLTMAPLLPSLLHDAAHQRGTTLLVRVAYEASVLLRNLGYRNLSWPAARVAVQAAQEADDPAWLGAASFVYALSLPLESAAVARQISERSTDELQAAAARPDARQMLGQLHLSAGLSAAVDRQANDAEAHLRAAAEEARSLGDPEDGQGFNLSGFGPTNVALWRMAIYAELAEYGKVLETAKTIRPDVLSVANRHQAYHLNIGRALAHSGKNDKLALIAFANAERAAPTPFRLNPLAREAIVAMIGRARRRSVADDLRDMARRLGIDPFAHNR